MSRKNRKKPSPTHWLKDLFTGLIRLTIVITVFLGSDDYQITTVIQLNAAAYYELRKLTGSKQAHIAKYSNAHQATRLKYS